MPITFSFFKFHQYPEPESAKRGLSVIFHVDKGDKGPGTHRFPCFSPHPEPLATDLPEEMGMTSPKEDGKCNLMVLLGAQ